MAKHGKKATRVNAPDERIRQDIRRTLRKAGSLGVYIRWGEEEKKEIEREEARENFDKFLLPLLEFMEETQWRYQRSPEARRIAQQPIGGRVIRLITRQEMVSATVKAYWQKELGQSQKATVRRLTNKLRERVSKPRKKRQRQP